MRPFRFVASVLPCTAAALVAASLTARAGLAQRPTGAVGTYVAPRTWAPPPHGFDLLHQKIDVRFDVPRRAVSGVVTSTLVVTGQPTDTIRFNAENLTIDDATQGGRRLRFAADTAHVTVRLARRAAVGDTVEFALRYHGTPERGLYFVPRERVIWTQGEATETRAWVPTYDAPDDKTTWEFLVTADTGLSVLSNGRLVDVTAAGGAQRVWHWAQELPASTYLYSVVVGPFTVLRDQWRGVPVDYWVYPDTVQAAWRTFGETPTMIELYSRLLVPFPWAKYDQSADPRLHLRRDGERLGHDPDRRRAARRGRRAGGERPRPRGPRAGAPVVRRPHHDRRLGGRVAERGDGHLPGVGGDREDARARRGRARVDRAAARRDGRRTGCRRGRWCGASTRATIRSPCSSAATSIPRARSSRTSSGGCWATRCSGPGSSGS